MPPMITCTFSTYCLLNNERQRFPFRFLRHYLKQLWIKRSEASYRFYVLRCLLYATKEKNSCFFRPRNLNARFVWQHFCFRLPGKICSCCCWSRLTCFLVADKSHKQQLPDRPLHHFRASKSVDRRTLWCSETSMDGFRVSKIVKGWGGRFPWKSDHYK